MLQRLLEDHRVIDKLADARLALTARGQEISVSTLSQEISMSVVSTLYAVSFHNAWRTLGLDQTTECQGPHTTYH